MSCRAVLFLILVMLASSRGRADAVVDEWLAAFQSRLEQGGGIEDLCGRLGELEGATLKRLGAELGRVWPGVRDGYLEGLGEAAPRGGAGARADRRVRELRESFMRVHAMAEPAMKPQLEQTSRPALDELRRLLQPTATELAAAGPAGLAERRRGALLLARFRDAVLDAELSSIPADSVSSLGVREDEIADGAAGLPRDGLRTLARNREVAGRAGIPEDEARGIEECNRWRMLVGLDALVLDPKLCEAARDHSRDMAEQGFFAHESPVRGKTTPGDRAGNFGTTASGENIFMGSPDPRAANLAWFLSPGHHKNMFGSGHKRIGLGRHGTHWTQMFGR